MNSRQTAPARLRQRRGFSMIEMLTVMAVLVIMLVGATRVSRSWGGQEVLASATRLTQELNLAQTLAIKRNQPVEFRIYRTMDRTIATTEPYYHLYQLVGYDSRQQRLIPLTEPQRLEGSTVMVPSPRFSSLMLTERTFDFSQDPMPGMVAAGMRFCSIEFRPDGSTSLDPDPAHQWTITLAEEREARPSGQPPATSRTLVITAETGAVVAY